MRTIIAGTRTITDYQLVKDAVKESGFEISVVICGMAKGVDSLGLQYAEENDLPVEKYPANWEKFGKSAGYKRNVEMADVADALIAVTTGSPGTRHMIDIARAKGFKVFVKEVVTLPWWIKV